MEKEIRKLWFKVFLAKSESNFFFEIKIRPDPNPSLIVKFRIRPNPNLNLKLGFGRIRVRILDSIDYYIKLFFKNLTLLVSNVLWRQICQFNINIQILKYHKCIPVFFKDNYAYLK